MSYYRGFLTEYDRFGDPYHIPVQSVKLRRLRKTLGLTQQEFARSIGCPINKYSLLEQGKLEKLGVDYIDAFPLWMIWGVVKTTRVNPYWISNDDPESIYEAVPELTAASFYEASFGFERGMFATDEVIEEWRRKREIIYGKRWQNIRV